MKWRSSQSPPYFLQDVGEAIWEGMQAIGKFFAEDVVQFAQNAIAAVGEWVRQTLVTYENSDVRWNALIDTPCALDSFLFPGKEVCWCYC
jgi:prolyl oligopeptidase PreP (S9A serine peptidase family)